MELPDLVGEEVDAVLNAAQDKAEEGQSNWPGMTYEQGVANTILWLRGQQESPMSDD